MNLFDYLLFRNYLEKGEKIQYVAHKHWFDALKPMSRVTVFGILPPALLLIFFIGLNLSNPFFWILAIWGVAAIFSFLYIWLDWYYDAWILTDSALIDLDWKSLFERKASRIEYTAISSVNYEYKGFWGYVLNFANMRLEKKSDDLVDLDNVASPRKVQAKVVALQEAATTHKTMTDSESLKGLLAEIIKTHVKK